MDLAKYLVQSRKLINAILFTLHSLATQGVVTNHKVVVLFISFFFGVRLMY